MLTIMGALGKSFEKFPQLEVIGFAWGSEEGRKVSCWWRVRELIWGRLHNRN